MFLKAGQTMDDEKGCVWVTWTIRLGCGVPPM